MWWWPAFLYPPPAPAFVAAASVAQFALLANAGLGELRGEHMAYSSSGRSSPEEEERRRRRRRRAAAQPAGDAGGVRAGVRRRGGVVRRARRRGGRARPGPQRRAHRPLSQTNSRGNSWPCQLPPVFAINYAHSLIAIEFTCVRL